MNINSNYKIATALGVPLFNFYYHPHFIGKNLIPTGEALILCGNHLNVLDQFPVICALRSVDKEIITHWMAKKEYFDKPFIGSFFRNTGAIEVDRYGDPSKARKEAISYLKKGESIGIFPEGTRNIYHPLKLKIEEIKKQMERTRIQYRQRLIDNIEYNNIMNYYKEQLLNIDKEVDIVRSKLKKRDIELIEDDLVLPFKYGTVSMARVTGAVIVPFAVTGSFSFRSKDLMVRFGEGFSLGRYDNLELANDKLRNDVIKLVKKNYKMS